MKVNAVVAKAHSQIEKITNAKALAVMRQNVTKFAGLGDDAKAALLSAIDEKLRLLNPKLATSLLGPKDAKAEKFLEKILAMMNDRFDLSGNVLAKNNVKVGGNQIDGTQHVNRYVAYKTQGGMSLAISWDQDRIDTEPYIRIVLRKIDYAGSKPILEEVFQDEASAQELFFSELEKLMSN